MFIEIIAKYTFMENYCIVKSFEKVTIRTVPASTTAAQSCRQAQSSNWISTLLVFKFLALFNATTSNRTLTPFVTLNILTPQTNFIHIVFFLIYLGDEDVL